VNIDVPIVAKNPYLPTYFPSATERSSATVLSVEDRQTINTDIAIPRLAVRRDVVLHIEWPNGKPAEGAQVWLQETRTPYRIAGTGLVTHTDEHGYMVIPAFEGFAYARMQRRMCSIPSHTSTAALSQRKSTGQEWEGMLC
jgi:hypothetical protein